MIKQQGIILQNLRLASTSFLLASRVKGIEQLSLIQAGSLQAVAAYTVYLKSYLAEYMSFDKREGYEFALAEVERCLLQAKASLSSVKSSSISLIDTELVLFEPSNSADFFKVVLSSHQCLMADWLLLFDSKAHDVGDENLIARSSPQPAKHWTQYSLAEYDTHFSVLKSHIENNLSLSVEY